MAGPFPVANRPSGYRRLGALVLASVTAMALTSPLAAAEDDLQDKHRKVEREIDHAEHDLESSSARAARAAASLRRAEASLRTAQTRLAGTRAQLRAAQALDLRMRKALATAVNNLETARDELAEGQRQVAVQKEEIADLVTRIYEQGDPRVIGFVAVVQAGDPGDMTRAIAFNEAYGNREDAVLADLETAERELAEREQEVEQRKAEVAESRAVAAKNLVTKARLEDAAAAQTAQVQSLVDRRATIEASAARARAADRAVLRRLEKKEAEISEMLRRRAQKALQNGAPGQSDGYLSYPVNGPITSPYGYRVHPIDGGYRLHNGVDFGAGCGAPLFAAADGVVVARGGGDWDPSGNYLFIDHGGVAGVGLSVSYSHATSYIVSVGQRVRRGQTVGYVGSTGWSTGCHLHFTVKENGVNVDPMKWL